MKKIIALIVCFASFSAFAQMVNGYTRSNGTYVAPHFRSAQMVLRTTTMVADKKEAPI